MLPEQFKKNKVPGFCTGAFNAPRQTLQFYLFII